MAKNSYTILRSRQPTFSKSFWMETMFSELPAGPISTKTYVYVYNRDTRVMHVT